MKFVYLPETRRKLKELYPEANITVRQAKDKVVVTEEFKEQATPAQYRQAERERKWISDDELH